MKKFLIVTLCLMTLINSNCFAISIPGQPHKQIPAYKSANDIKEDIIHPVANNVNSYDNTSKPIIEIIPTSISIDVNNNIGAGIIWAKDGRNSFRDDTDSVSVSAIDRFIPINRHFSNNAIYIPANDSVKVNMTGYNRIKFRITVEDAGNIDSETSMVVKSGENILCSYSNFVPKSIDNYYVWVDEGTNEIEIYFNIGNYSKTNKDAKLLIIDPEVYNQ